MKHSWLFIVLLLTGCAIQQAELPPQTIAWQVRQQRLQQLHHWQLAGAISYDDTEQSARGAINWTQDHRQANIKLHGPFGQGSTELHGTAAAMQAQTQLALPFKALRYWASGQPIPGKPKRIQLDRYQRIASLKQLGWTVKFQRYQTFAHYDLPKKITLTNGKYRIRLVVKQWQV